jgi:RNA-directed DNA polymerase
VLNLQKPDELASALKTPVRALFQIVKHADQYYEDLILLDPRKPGKERPVVNARGKLRRLQQLFYQHLLLPNLQRSPHSHGGVPGRNILTNIQPHLDQAFVFTTDICNFYPSVHRQRVLKLFLGWGCSRDMAELCTRLCTYRHCLAQGLVTSPILADYLVRPVDDRIAGVCRNHGLVYTRFVDDIAISGPFDLEHSGFAKLIERILNENGFPVNEKRRFGSVTEGASITKLRFPHGHPDVAKSYRQEVIRQLADVGKLAAGEPFEGPYYTESQIRGRVQFICSVNPGHRRHLMSLVKKVNWSLVRSEAEKRNLVIVAARLVRPE